MLFIKLTILIATYILNFSSIISNKKIGTSISTSANIIGIKGVILYCYNTNSMLRLYFNIVTIP